MRDIPVGRLSKDGRFLFYPFIKDSSMNSVLYKSHWLWIPAKACWTGIGEPPVPYIKEK